MPVTDAMPTPTDPLAHADVRLMAGVPHCVGQWTVHGVADLAARLARVRWPEGDFMLDGVHIQTLDTTGALVLMDTVAELRRHGHNVHIANLKPAQQTLLALVLERRPTPEAHLPAPRPGLLASIGQVVWGKCCHINDFLAFLGETSVVFARTLLKPQHIRWRSLMAIIETAGFNALPIIGLLCFLIGLVIAYQGGNLLITYGANIFIVELVSISMVRELAPLMAAIIVAGRTGSAFTAQIGTMNVTEEVDALRTLGLDPFEVLVLPKVLGLMIVLPLLTLYADVLSILGGMTVAVVMLDVSVAEFMARIPQVVSLFSFGYGIGKAPAFAMAIALVGCYQGFQVGGGADSVGRQTTQSVVQAIFLVIVLNALFAVAWGGTGL